MARTDLNLLVTLDVLLAEGSVARAAQRLKLSPSAMSRTLARLREATGDPLLVRAGRKLVPTPHALALRARVGPLVREAEEVLRPAEGSDPARLSRTFTLRTSEGFVETFGPALLARVTREAPLVKLCFAPKPDKGSTALREGSVDLETGVVEASSGPELLTQALFRDRLVGVVRAGHPLSTGRMSAARYAAGRHVSVSRAGLGRDVIDEALAKLGLTREVAAVLAGGFAGALGLARASDLIVTVPAEHTATLRDGMHTFTLPLAMAPFTVSMLWHPRLDVDPAHRWLRTALREVCKERVGQGAPTARTPKGRSGRPRAAR